MKWTGLASLFQKRIYNWEILSDNLNTQKPAGSDIKVWGMSVPGRLLLPASLDRDQEEHAYFIWKRVEEWEGTSLKTQFLLR